VRPATVIYLDESLLIVNKPPGLSLATRRAEPLAAVERVLNALPPAECEQLGLSVESLWLVHRLDVGTSGLVMLARTRSIHAELARELTERRIAKTYLALVWGHLRPREGIFEWRMGPDRHDRRRMKVDPQGRVALTRYRTLADGPHTGLLELRAETGRTHQLRVHLAHAGHWIVGDDLYGGPRHKGVRRADLRALLNPGHTLLHAWKLELPSIGSRPGMVFEAPLPETFSQALSGLGIVLAGEANH